MEIVIELLVEIFGELIFWIIGAVFTELYKIYKSDGATKKTIKNICVFILFGFIVGLLVYAIFTKRGLYIQIALSYLIVMFFIKIAEFINRNYYNSNFLGMIRIIKSLFQYFFASLVIYFASLDEVTDGETYIIVLTSLSIIVFITLDVFRIVKRFKKNRKIKVENNK